MPESSLTVLISAHNEARVIGYTLPSLWSQTWRPDKILVVDDGSSDDTGRIAADLGAEVVRPASNTGFEAGAMSFGLRFVETERLVTLDADTILVPDALQQIVTTPQEQNARATCGLVLPQRIHTLSERARFVEYPLLLGYASLCGAGTAAPRLPPVASPCTERQLSSSWVAFPQRRWEKTWI